MVWFYLSRIEHLVAMLTAMLQPYWLGYAGQLKTELLQLCYKHNKNLVAFVADMP